MLVKPFGRSSTYAKTPSMVSYSTPTGGESTEKLVTTVPPSADAANFDKQNVFAKLGDLHYKATHNRAHEKMDDKAK